jgi:protein-S-isoprenylcysteine O-methyltransferase Ste14
MYSSLLLVFWGALLKNISAYGIPAVLITSAFLVVTAKMEERENITFFGSGYELYIKNQDVHSLPVLKSMSWPQCGD